MFDRMPAEIAVNILSYLDKKDLGQIATVSKHVKSLSEDNSLWLDPIITRKLMEKTNCSAKELNKYRFLWTLKGNYLQKILDGQIELSDIKKLLNIYLPAENKKFTVDTIIGPSVGHLDTSVLTERDFFANSARFQSNYSVALFPAVEQIPVLAHQDLSEYFEMITKGGRTSARPREPFDKTALTRCNCVIIISEHPNELAIICDEINRLSEENLWPAPPVFVVTHHEKIRHEQEEISANIIDIIPFEILRMRGLFSEVGLKLNKLTSIANASREKESIREHKKENTNTRCITM